MSLRGNTVASSLSTLFDMHGVDAVVFVQVKMLATTENLEDLPSEIRCGDEEDVETRDRVDVEEDDADDSKEKIVRRRRDALVGEFSEVDVFSTVGNVREDQCEALKENHLGEMLIDNGMARLTTAFQRLQMFVRQRTKDREKTDR